jgi:SRSO17 transposase
LPEDIEFAALVDIAKLRWRIERDYQELKQEVGRRLSLARPTVDVG